MEDRPTKPHAEQAYGTILTVFEVEEAKASESQKLEKPPEKEATPANLNKPNELIQIIASRGTKPLSLIQHRCFNTLLAEAQRQKVPGTVLPVFPVGTDLEQMSEYFWMPVPEVARDTWGSKELKKLRDTLTSLQQLSFETFDGSWVSETPVSSVRLLKSGGQYWVGFHFSPKTRSLLHQPRQYTQLSLKYQKGFNSLPSVRLYEICRRYATNKSHMTATWSWGDWYYQLTGRSRDSKLPEWRFWNRDILKPAEAAVNSLTDIRIVRKEGRVSRGMVTTLQYEVHLVEDHFQPCLDEPSNPELIGSDTETRSIIERIEALEVPKKVARTLAAEHDPSTLAANLKLTEEKQRQGGIRTSAGGFLRRALENNYAGATNVAKESVRTDAARSEPQAPKGPSVLDRYLAHHAKEAAVMFGEMSAAEQAALLAEFAETPEGKMAKARGKQLSDLGPAARNVLATWLVQRNLGTPTTEELLDFANQYLVPKV